MAHYFRSAWQNQARPLWNLLRPRLSAGGALIYRGAKEFTSDLFTRSARGISAGAEKFFTVAAPIGIVFFFAPPSLIGHRLKEINEEFNEGYSNKKATVEAVIRSSKKPLEISDGRGAATGSKVVPEEYHQDLQQELVALFNQKTSMNCVILNGVRGTGKSWTIDYVLKQLRKDDKEMPIIRVNLKGIVSADALVVALASAMGINDHEMEFQLSTMVTFSTRHSASEEYPVIKLRRLMDILAEVMSLLKKEKSQRLLLVVDDLEAISPDSSAQKAFDIFLEFCRFWTKDDKLSVLMASSSSFTARHLGSGGDKYITVGDLPEAEATKYIKEQLFQDRREDVDDLVQKVSEEVGKKISDIRSFAQLVNNELRKSGKRELDSVLLKDFFNKLNANATVEFSYVMFDLAKRYSVEQIIETLQHFEGEGTNVSLVQLHLKGKSKSYRESYLQLLEELIDKQVLAYGSANDTIVFGSVIKKRAFVNYKNGMNKQEAAQQPIPETVQDTQQPGSEIK